jgi:phosphate starvation-inducible PhoH-like protein
MEIIEKKLRIEDAELISAFELNDNFLQLIQNRFKTAVLIRGENLILKGYTDEIKIIERLFREFSYLLKRNGVILQSDISTILELIDTKGYDEIKHNGNNKNPVIYNGVKEIIRVKSQKQLEYYEKVLNNDLVFAIGPAGTGKTFLAVAMALAALRLNEVSKIIITRPAVEAGESLGFLPGDMREKIDPYLRPLTDAMHYLLSGDKLKALLEKQTIEITPLAYMRGRTLNNAFIILDEAQNATRTQMKMFLTRFGPNSKVIITGDVTQIDLQNKEDSGLIHASNILKGIKGIEFVYFSNKDVVRHKLVAEIIKAYEKETKSETKKSSGKTKND